MIRDTASLIAADSPELLLFYGGQPKEKLNNSCFSQWWPAHPFIVKDRYYETAEHYMMAEKARLFNDHVTLEKILKVKHPSDAKRLGREVSGFNESKWLENRWEIVVSGSVAKFSNKELRTYLISTGDKVLVEASPYDRIWGIGLAITDPKALDPKSWCGLNLLGFALMEARDRLK